MKRHLYRTIILPHAIFGIKRMQIQHLRQVDPTRRKAIINVKAIKKVNFSKPCSRLRQCRNCLCRQEQLRPTTKGACVMSCLIYFCYHNRAGQIVWVCHFMTGKNSNFMPCVSGIFCTNSPGPLCFQDPDETINRSIMQRATGPCEYDFI